jgi:hypothetical protein
MRIMARLTATILAVACLTACQAVGEGSQPAASARLERIGFRPVPTAEHNASFDVSAISTTAVYACLPSTCGDAVFVKFGWDTLPDDSYRGARDVAAMPPAKALKHVADGIRKGSDGTLEITSVSIRRMSSGAYVMIMDGTASVGAKSFHMRMSEVSTPQVSRVIQSMSPNRALARRYGDPSWLD